MMNQCDDSSYSTENQSVDIIAYQVVRIKK